MLSCPVHGWCTVTIGDWHDDVSYITDDFAFSILNAFKKLHEKRKPTGVYCDAEGHEFILVFDDCNGYLDKNYVYVVIIDEDLTPIIKKFEVDLKSLMRECVNDIKENIDKWVSWNCDADEYNDVRKAEIKKRLLRLIENVEQL